jgi:hypothetical protein
MSPRILSAWAFFAVAVVPLGCGSVKYYSHDDPHHGLIKITCVRDQGCRDRAVEECPDGYREIASGDGFLSIECRERRRSESAR